MITKVGHEWSIATTTVPNGYKIILKCHFLNKYSKSVRYGTVQYSIGSWLPRIAAALLEDTLLSSGFVLEVGLIAVHDVGEQYPFQLPLDIGKIITNNGRRDSSS
jgi:hypothetical protein